VQIIKIFIFTCTLFLTGCEFFGDSQVYTGSIHPSKTTKKTVQVGDQVFIVEVADTSAKRTQGLMFREKLEEGHGMLFVFEKEGSHRFWMKNTLIPLDVIWISADNKVVDVQTLQPCIEKNCPATTPVSPAKYVLEVNGGAFRKTIGDRIQINP